LYIDTIKILSKVSADMHIDMRVSIVSEKPFD